jgi:hypothetical protein
MQTLTKNQPKRQNNLSLTWVKHLPQGDEEALKKFSDALAVSDLVLKRLASILEEKINCREVFKEEDYKEPSWAYHAADRNGYVRAMTEVLNILKGT